MFPGFGLIGKYVTSSYVLGGLTGAMISGIYYNRSIKDFNIDYYPNFENNKIAASIEELLNKHWHPNFIQSANPIPQFVYIGKVYKPTLKEQFDREYIVLPDGGQISLDFSKRNNKSKKKMIVLIHGLTGGSEAAYMKHMALNADKNDFNSVVFQFRGINKTPLLDPIPSHPSSLFEIQKGLEKINELYPDQEQYIAGFSMGGNYLIRYLSDYYPKTDRKFNIKVGVSVSPPFDVNHAVNTIKGTVYEDHFINLQILAIKNNEKLLRSYESKYNFSYDKIIKSKSLLDLHTEYSCKVFGEDSMESLLSKYKIYPEHIENIKVPMLIQQSNDDAICKTEKVQKDEIVRNKNLIYLETNIGAHICWLSGNDTSPKPFYDKIIFKYFDEVSNKMRITA